VTEPVQIWPDEFAARYRAEGYWTGETFPAMLRRIAKTHATRTAVVGGAERWTYAELSARAEAAAAGFLAHGLEPGDRVLVQLPNIPEFLSVVFGLFLARLIPVYALPAHRLTEISHLAEKSGARAYVIAQSHDGFDYTKLAAEVLAKVPALRDVIVLGATDTYIPFESLLGQTATLPEDPDPSSVAFLQISGGSTGLSKLIPRTHDDYLYSVRESARICGVGPQTVFLACLPIAHNFPMSSPGFLGVLHAGGTIVMSPSPAPPTAFALIEREKVTLGALVPPLALLWLQAAATTKHDISSLEVLLVGGAKFTAEAARRVRPLLGCQLQQVFGMAEGLVNYTRLDDPEELVVTTQGYPISPDDELLILDDAGNPVADGEPGHLLTRGPYTIRAYYNEPAANQRAFTEDGFYRTGDVVKKLPSGHLEVQGRATDHINRAGEKISAEEIEDHLLAHDAVYDVAVVSMPDPFLGERSCAFVICADAASVTPAELKAFMRQRGIADFKVPDEVVFVESFETTAAGKTSRRDLRARLRQTHLQTTTPPARKA